MVFAEMLTATLVGCCLGIFTGLIPGIHVNMVAAVALSIFPLLARFASPISIAAALVSMSITHVFLTSIPSVFLGAPNPDTCLAVLPGHKMLMKGRGYEAVMLCVSGALLSLAATVLLTPLIAVFSSVAFPAIRGLVGFLLIASSIFLLSREREKAWAFVVFMLSGCLGIIALNMPALKEPLLPMFSGMFGIPSLIISAKGNAKVPGQTRGKYSISDNKSAKLTAASVAASSCCSLLPALGPAQAAVLAMQCVREKDGDEYLFLTGGLSSANMAVSLIMLYSISKARNGSIVVASEMAGSMGIATLLIFLAIALISAFIAVMLAMFVARKASRLICRVNYRLLCYSVVAFVSVVAFLLSGWLGMLVMVTAACIGLMPILKGVGRNHMMASLILPVVSYYVL